MSEPIETLEHNGFTIEIHADPDAKSPRTFCDNLGTFWTMERRYVSPDTIEPVRGNIFQSVAEKFGGVAEASSNAKALDKGAIWLPVWKYEHGGVVYKAAEANPFSCQWESGQAGYIFVSKEDVRKEYGVRRISPAVREKALKCLRGEVEAYSRWAGGEYTGYIVKGADGEEVDSCWGFDDMAYCIEAAKEACPEGEEA